VYIEPGTFTMGSPSSESGRDDDETQHQVTLTKGYYMQTTEVTRGQWYAVMGNKSPCSTASCAGDNYPVENVNWEGVQKFITALNEKEKTDLYRLPTEAEWEYAGRAGSTTAFANGDISVTGCDLDSKLDAMGWYCGNATDGKTHPVGQKQANAWGLYDMHGNVCEWCNDLHDSYSTNSVTDPEPSSGTGRVYRGGCWSCSAQSCRSANRGSAGPILSYGLGFRLLKIP